MPGQESSQDANQRSWEADTTDTGSEWENQQDTLSSEGSAYPQEQNQQTEGSQDAGELEDNWGSEDMGAHQSTWEDSEGDQNQQATDDDALGMEEGTGTGDEWGGKDTTTTTARIDTTTVYDNEMEQDESVEGDDSTLPQEQNQQTDEWGVQDTTNTQDEYGTTPADTTGSFDDQMMEDNTLDNDDSAFPQEQNQQTDEWGETDTTNTSNEFGTTPDDTTGTYNDQMMEDNNLDGNDAASPQEQYQSTGNEDVDYNEEIQENELPASITNSLDELYPDNEIEEAYRADDGSYKITIKNKDDKVAVYYDSEGLFYRDENLNDMLEDSNKNTNQDW